MTVKIPLQLERLVNERWTAALELTRAIAANTDHGTGGHSAVYHRLQDAAAEYDRLTKRWRAVEHLIVKEQVTESYTRVRVATDKVFPWPSVDGAERSRLARELAE